MKRSWFCGVLVILVTVVGAESAIVRAQQAPAAINRRARAVSTDQVPAGAESSGDDASSLAKRVADLEAARAQQRKWIDTLAADLKAVHADLESLKSRVKN